MAPIINILRSESENVAKHAAASSLRQKNLKTQHYLFLLLGLPSTLICPEYGAFRETLFKPMYLKTPAFHFRLVFRKWRFIRKDGV